MSLRTRTSTEQTQMLRYVAGDERLALYGPVKISRSEESWQEYIDKMLEEDPGAHAFQLVTEIETTTVVSHYQELR